MVDLVAAALGRKGWIGVDLDGTLFHYEKWVGWNVFGEPIAPMVERVRAWLAAKQEVRIVTARVGVPLFVSTTGELSFSGNLAHTCRVTGTLFSDTMMVRAIQSHCLRHIGWSLPVQCHKDVNMIELWDDRAVQVVANTGRTLAEEHEAVVTALRGKGFGS
jgi:hypothetical protein